MKAVLLDRDGTIGGTGRGIHPNEFTLFDFAPKAIQKLNNLGLKVFLSFSARRLHLICITVETQQFRWR
ncbi:hypothetical protein ACQKOA_25060 [Bacillus mobilis]|uniref:hypothetical protein n=1 Tax=Bacillus mobilis TaxID=2026190 RepID=UPI003CFF6467